jgi:hypothetical protein
MPNYIFTTPTVLERGSGGHRLFQFYNRSIGVSVYKDNGAYATARFPNGDDITTWDEFYQGGSKHIVTEAIKTAMIAANIGVTESNFVAQ